MSQIHEPCPGCILGLPGNLALAEHGATCTGEPHRRALTLPSLSLSPRGQKLLGKLCEQNKVLREQERLVQQLRAEKVRGGQLKQPAGDKPGCTWWS